MPHQEDPLHLSREQLHEVRQNSDWRQLFSALDIQKDERKSREADWWGISPLNPREGTSSFHMNDRGWYCHSTSRGGGPIELVQAVRGEMSCWEAGRWLLEHRVSYLASETRVAIEETAASTSEPEKASKEPIPKEIPKENASIRQDLRRAMDTAHPAFADRGISPAVLEQLGAGYWERQKPRKDGRSDPLSGRLVFQIRGLHEDERGQLYPVVLTHTGRAVTAEQMERDGKWWTYPGSRKSLELYNLDLAILDDEAHAQACQYEHVIIVEGCFDVAKLWAAGIRNVVATLGARLCPDQLPRIELISEMLGVDRFPDLVRPGSGRCRSREAGRQ